MGAFGGFTLGAAGCFGFLTSKKKTECQEKQWRKIVILFGAPGAGKGTQAPFIEEKYKLAHLATGDMLREAVAAGTDVGKQAEAVMKSGGLVTDEIVIGIIKDRINSRDCGWGFILDGFPRTLPQAKELDDMLSKGNEKVNAVIELHVPDAVLEERICGRWIHKKSGRSYHVKFAAPKSYDGKSTPSAQNMLDDETGEPLFQRPDDTSEALVNRLVSYHKSTVPVLGHYKAVHTKVNANQKQQQVQTQIDSALII